MAASFVITTPLHTAARSGDLVKVRKLLKSRKYSVNCTDFNGQTPLHCACSKGHLDLVRVLISGFEADITIHDDNGATALMLAALAGHHEVVHSLLSEYKCPMDAIETCSITLFFITHVQEGMLRW